MEFTYADMVKMALLMELVDKQAEIARDFAGEFERVRVLRFVRLDGQPVRGTDQLGGMYVVVFDEECGELVWEALLLARRIDTGEPDGWRVQYA
jgi:hypothetical protein